MGFFDKLVGSISKVDKNFSKIGGWEPAMDVRRSREKKKLQEAEALAKQEAQRKLAEQAAENLKRNLATDLDIENVANVTAGGSAEQMGIGVLGGDTAGAGTQLGVGNPVLDAKKRKQTAADRLGII